MGWEHAVKLVKNFSAKKCGHDETGIKKVTVVMVNFLCGRPTGSYIECLMNEV